MPFQDNTPEHPHINYHHTPIAAINQLLMLIKKTTVRLKKLRCPVLLIQGDNDPVVNPSSMAELSKHIPQEQLTQHLRLAQIDTASCMKTLITANKKSLTLFASKANSVK